MTADRRRPVVVGFDGSPAAVGAVEEAAALFQSRLLLVATVWEPGLAMLAMTSPDPLPDGLRPADGGAGGMG